MFVGSNAPYGYLKDPNNKNKLIINEETASVVRKIFDLMLSGYGAVHIARLLTKEKILTPAATKSKSGDTRFQRYLDGGYEYTWSDGMIQKILRNQTYIGDMVNAKTQVISYKTKKSIHNKKDKYIIVPNTHEAIIDRNNFERVQNLCKQRHNPRKIVNIENIFKGLVKCSVCGRNMVLTTQNRYGKRVLQYRCNTFVSTRVDEKHWVTIKYDDIKEIIKSRLKEFFALFKDDDKLIDLIQKKVNENNASVDLEKELAKITTRQNTLSNITKKVYDDYFENLISHQTYQNLIKKYKDEENELEKKKNHLSAEKSKKDNYLDDINKLREIVNSFLDLKELTQEMVYNLVEKIEIGNIGEYKQHKQRVVIIDL